MSTMQIVFSIIGLMLIAGIIGHGVWTIRRNEKVQRARAQTVEQKRNQANANGFDNDGIGEVRVVKRASATVTKATSGEENQPKTDDTAEKPSYTDQNMAEQAIRATAEEQDIELPEVKVEADAARKAQVQQQKPVSAKPSKSTSASSGKATEASQPAQQSMDLPLERSDDEPMLNEEPEEVIVLHVTGDIEGAVLLQQMTELGFKFGDFDIFHRHVDTAGNGSVLFSLANMFNPGSFNIDTIETFQTDGVALFLALPIKSNSLQAFTMMHNAAVKLAAVVGHGQVLDENRNPLTRQAVQHIHQRIREFERKRLIKHA